MRRKPKRRPVLLVYLEGGHSFMLETKDYLGAPEEIAREFIKSGVPEPQRDGRIIVHPGRKVDHIAVTWAEPMEASRP